MTTTPDTERRERWEDAMAGPIANPRLIRSAATEGMHMADLEAAEARAAALDEAERAVRALKQPSCDPDCDFCLGVDAAADKVRDLAAARPDAAPETEAHPVRNRWAVETRDPGADEWVPGHRFLNRHHAVERLAALTENHPVWYDGTPAQRRLVRETTTHTVEAAAARPDNTTGTGPATPTTPRCATCSHTKRDHSGRADHRARHSALVAGDPWCHACNARCDFAEPTARPDDTTGA